MKINIYAPVDKVGNSVEAKLLFIQKHSRLLDDKYKEEALYLIQRDVKELTKDDLKMIKKSASKIKAILENLRASTIARYVKGLSNPYRTALAPANSRYV